MPALSEKEILNQLFDENQKYPVQEVGIEPKIDKEVEPLIQKLEKEIYLNKPITDDGGQPIVSPAAPVQPKITLPVSQNSYVLGLKKQVNNSIRWLAEWCCRLIKIFGPNAVFRENQT